MINSQTRLQRGHFTLKSSALAPTAMSYMGQDFIANHMKSHYRRILTAKAAVDTSPPKSMKMHMKVRDQKKRAALESRANTPQSFLTRSPSLEELSSLHNGLSAVDSFRSEKSLGNFRPSTGTPTQRSQSEQSLEMYYSPNVPTSSPRDREGTQSQYRHILTKPGQPLLKPPVSPIPREPREEFRTGKQLTPRKDVRHTTLESLKSSEQTTSYNFRDNVSTLMSGYRESDDVKASLTAGYSDEKEKWTGKGEFGMRSSRLSDKESKTRLHGVPRLDLKQVLYSHRAPPSIRTINDSTDSKANIWDEEQQYLKFISDVTTDILARGIFSNRVLQKVFDMHIERWKDQLDGNRLQEMIEELKEDLGVTDS